ncbi:MAG: hypothetical protein IKV44_00455 [Clostridia bacterium]|nr:hypothetical protein [Clostridia bacterium]
MNKLKGSSSAIKMKYLLFVFATVFLVALPTRVYQLLALVNTQNGFFENGDITIPVLYAVLFVFVLMFMMLSFLSKEVPSPKLPTGKNPLLGATSIIMIAGLVWDIIAVENLVVPKTGMDFNMSIFTSLLKANVQDNGGVLLVLQFVFAVFAIFYFLVFAISHLNGKGSYKEFKLLALSPLCWCITMLVSRLMKAVSFITVSELLFEIFMLVFAMLFFLTFARISSGVFTEDSMWGIYGYGLSACLFAGLVTIPRLVAAFSGLEAVEGHDFSLAHLSILVFIFSYIIASLGVGFKDGIVNRKTVTEIELPDEDIVISKGSVGAFIAEVDEISEVEDEAADFFEDETAYTDDEMLESVSDKRAEKARNFFEGFDEPAVQETVEVPVVEEAVEEPVVEVAEEEPVIEAIVEEPVIEIIAEEPVAEVIEEEPVVVEIAEEPVQAVEEDEKPRKPFGRRKEESEPEVIKPISLADMRKNKEN